VGLVVAVDGEGGDDLKSVLLAPDSEPLFPATLLELGSWISRYYTTPIGLTFRAMLPSALWGSSQLVAEVRDRSSGAGGASRDVMMALTRAGGRASATMLARKLRRPVWDTLQRLARAGAVVLETEPPRLGPTAGIERVLVLTSVVPSLVERDRVFGRAERQRAAYEAADALGGEVVIKHLIDQLGFSRAVLNGLVDRGLARFEERQKLRDPFAAVVGSPAPRLSLSALLSKASTGTSSEAAHSIIRRSGSRKPLRTSTVTISPRSRSAGGRAPRGPGRERRRVRRPLRRRRMDALQVQPGREATDLPDVPTDHGEGVPLVPPAIAWSHADPLPSLVRWLAALLRR